MRNMAQEFIHDHTESPRMPDKENSGTQNAVSNALGSSGWMLQALLTRPFQNMNRSTRAVRR